LAHIREVRRKAVLLAESSDKKRVPLAASVLVLAPTRELARQIEQEALKFGSALGLRTA
jgi:superfamily II DNA/RNA helicase